MIPLAVDAFGGGIAGATLIATVIGAIAAFIKARKEAAAVETTSVIEVNQDLRRELRRRGEECKELREENAKLHDEIGTQRDEINALQERVAGLRTQVEELDVELKRVLANSPGSA